MKMTVSPERTTPFKRTEALPLGQKLRLLRQQAGFTLATLSKKSSLALGTLSRLENNKGGGTNLKTHQKLCDALGISLQELYADVPVQDVEGHPILPGSQDVETFVYDEKASAILLAKQVMQKNMLPQLLVLQPGGQTHPERTKPGCEKWVFVLEGTVEIIVGEQHYSLKRYGTLYFKASVPHQVRNAGARVAKCVSVTSPVGL